MTRDRTDVAVHQDVVDLLINQHMAIRDLFTEVGSATGDARTEAFHRLVKLLAVHETVEEQVVHPLTRLHVHGGNEIADDRLTEEHDAKETLVALEEMGPHAPEFSRLLTQLRTDVLAHAAKEEAYEFRYLRRDVPAVQLRTLVPMVKAAAAIAPTRPHPGGGVGHRQHPPRAGTVPFRPNQGPGPKTPVQAVNRWSTSHITAVAGR